MPYKIVEFEGNYSIQKDNMSIPRSTDNRHYTQFIKDIALGDDTVEGPDVTELSYVELRQAEYPPMVEQLDMQYWDSVNGTSNWADAIQAIKDKYPTSITGGVTVGEVPAWVQEEADAWLLEKQTRDYAEAVARLAQYRLAEGREEVQETVVIAQESVLDENGLPVLDEETGAPLMTDITETVVTQTAIDPLSATVEQWVESEDDPLVGSMQEVPNPAIVKDDEERAEAQAVIDATPQAVVDAYNQA
jgi:hypothetical protein